jgi:S-adenosylmethionine hydrolase
LGAIITLTTDFGISDPYVAAVKGAILRVNPDVTIIDVSHDIAPQRVGQGAFLLSCVVPYFPAGAIHVAVVDPGVGTSRRALALVSKAAVFIGPDNGVLSAGLADDEREQAGGKPRNITLPAGKQAFLISNPRFQNLPLSNTFHARDIFGPAAAYLSIGVAPSELGPGTNELVALPPFRATAARNGSLVGMVIHVDRFGNIITTVRADQLRSAAVRVNVAGREIQTLSRTYAESEDLLALIGSSGYLEIALRGRSATDALGVRIGDEVLVRQA